MYKIILLFVASLVITANASAQEQQRIRDYSLSPAESLNLPDVTNSYTNGNLQYLNQGGNSGYGGIGNGNLGAATPATRFMDGYCDPNFNPMIANNDKVSGMQSCIAQQKQLQCDLFRNLPPDVQRVVDDTANCLFAASNADETSVGRPPDCSANDSLRLQLLRKYGQNQAVAQALETLPEDVINASNKCVGRGRY